MTVPSRVKIWCQRVLLAVIVLGLVAALVFGMRSLLKASPLPKRQIARITILPDTPPPPPPPPREEPKKEPPKDQPRQVQEMRPQQATPPAPEPIKMEGAAGDAPSPFQAGPVTREYTDGAPVVGGASAPVGATASDRAQERFYANSARQLLRDAIERHLRLDAGELTATFSLWVEPDGRIRRYEVLPSGQSTQDAEMTQALDGTARTLKLPPPGALAQPMRFRLTVRSQG